MPSECTREEMAVQVVKMKDIYEETIVSHFKKDGRSHYSQCDSVLTIIGIDSYQFDLRIESLDLQQPEDGICIDSLKIFNGPRVDNANILTPMEGLCGSSLPLKTSFKTSRNYLTVRFKIESSSNEKREGFSIKIWQHEWKSPVNSQRGGFNPGGWNDGVASLFQWTWDLQVSVPGSSLSRPGQDLEKSYEGIQCVECASCSLEDFDWDRDVYTIAASCYICAKQWDISYNTAQRTCYSQRSYLSLIRRIKDPSINLDDPVTPGKLLGCHLYSNPYGVKINYCFCEENRCNSSRRNLPFNLLLLTFILLVLHL
ncbi:uncharacterized protein LOC106878819 [Octopus bimaculoides]|uniref:CUB domain-containing protein n=1 Tax=Octopus bimaculoides TaxID=37653 RepID=A0A0L8G6T7_OCTBM|nr:uncharacterized protein LOC106878819 [Octopus bimaculoides]|eukprot:XP_014783646.1 PREDICTED: uncharacterized protein LOC106878819 [Octopus bimaculoides]